jgi:hypothetical protein
MEIIDVERDDKTPQANLPSQPAAQVPPQPAPPASNFLGGLSIDVCFEASKLPLDVAIFNSARACGGDEKIRKYLQAVLVIGGGAQIPGMAHALESRWVSLKSRLPRSTVITRFKQIASNRHSIGSEHG